MNISTAVQNDNYEEHNGTYIVCMRREGRCEKFTKQPDKMHVTCTGCIDKKKISREEFLNIGEYLNASELSILQAEHRRQATARNGDT